MKFFSFKKNKAEKLAETLNESLKNQIETEMSEEELFSKAEFDEEAVERIGYSNYSYWRCTFKAFLKRKFAMFLLVLIAIILCFTVVQPYLPGECDDEKRAEIAKLAAEKAANGEKVDQKELDGDIGDFHNMHTQCDPNRGHKYINYKGEKVIAKNVEPYLTFKIKKALNKIGLVDDSELKYVAESVTDDRTGKVYTVVFEGEKYFEYKGKFLLGTDNDGRDIWARLWMGTRNSLFIGVCVALVEALIGIIVGVLWGYVRKLDFILTEVYNVLDNIPNTILLILISYIMRPSVSTLIFAMCLTGWIQMARFIRNQIIIIRDRDYNTASRCLGTPTRRILIKNCLPYLISVITLRIALTIPSVIGSEVFITYIGLGLPVTIPSLGRLIEDGRPLLATNNSYQLFFPVVVLSIITISFYIIGSAFSDSADPKNHR